MRGRPVAGLAPIHPPWSRPDCFTSLCTRCGTCAGPCPEAILRAGDSGYPEIDFARGECSFCGACTEPVFDRTMPPMPRDDITGAGTMGSVLEELTAISTVAEMTEAFRDGARYRRLVEAMAWPNGRL